MSKHHHAPRGLGRDRSNVYLASEGVKVGHVGILWDFYGYRNGQSHRPELSRHWRPSSSHKSPRSRTIDVAIVRPSAPRLNPFTGLFTGGEGPRSASTRAFSVRALTATSERRRFSPSLIPKISEPSRD